MSEGRSRKVLARRAKARSQFAPGVLGTGVLGPCLKEKKSEEGDSSPEGKGNSEPLDHRRICSFEVAECLQALGKHAVESSGCEVGAQEVGHGGRGRDGEARGRSLCRVDSHEVTGLIDPYNYRAVSNALRGTIRVKIGECRRQAVNLRALGTCHQLPETGHEENPGLARLASVRDRVRHIL